MLTGLVQDLQSDFSDDEGTPLLPEEVATRLVERALSTVSADLGVAYELVDGDVEPPMPTAHEEIWRLRSKILACRLLRSQAAQRVNFSSGDKSMSRSNEAKTWADLEKDLTTDYSKRVRLQNPENDEAFLHVDVSPVTYRQPVWWREFIPENGE